MENLITSIHGHARHLEEFAVEYLSPGSFRSRGVIRP